MAFTVEGYYEQTTNQGVLDRIEIQQDGGAGRNLQLEADASRNGFQWRLSEITSESEDGLINPLANKIQIGKLTFYPEIETAAHQTLLDDILGSEDNTFRIVWKRDGSVYWTGNIDNKKRSHPETGGRYFATIRANDFEILKSIDYTLDDTRQTLITTIADLLGNLNFGLNIRTATSWTEQNLDSSLAGDYDFLAHIYHETKALRDFARTGDESDQPISVWDALEKIGGPALLFRQVNGEFTVEQLTEFDDPANVVETVYDSTGTVSTATATVDRRLTGYKSTDDGSLVVKISSNNDRYPAVKRAKVKFEHRTNVSGIQFPKDIDLSDQSQEQQSQLFLSDGTQRMRISFESRCVIDDQNTTAQSRYRIQAGTYYLQDDGSWSTSTNTVENDMNKIKPADANNTDFRNSISLETDDLPADADGLLEVTVLYHTGDFSSVGDPSSDTVSEYSYFTFDIINEIASENSVFINYQLTQTGGYSTTFELTETWYGDGPTDYALSALRYGSADGDLTADSWQRRGTTTGYRNFHENLLKEIMDLQRSNVRKLDAQFWGAYDPTKILVYDSQNFYCAGVSYTGHMGRWSANLFRINIVTGTDTFDDIPKFLDEGVTGTSSTSSGDGGGIDQDTADLRYVNEAGDTMSGDLAMGSNNITGVNRILATGVEIDGDWQFRSQTPAGVNRLFIDALGADSNVEVFLAPSGTATQSTFTVSDNSNQNNYGGIEAQVTGSVGTIASIAEGTGTIRELQLRVDGDEDLSLWRNSTKYVDLTSTGIDFSQLTTHQAGMTDGFITYKSAQINRSGNKVELQFDGGAGSNVRLFGNTATPINFLSDGTATFSGLTTHQAGIDVEGRVEAIRMKGAATTASNVTYAEFLRSDNTRSGFVGEGSSANSDIYLAADINAVRIKGPGGVIVESALTTQAGATISGGDLTVDTNTLFVDASANAVGIGTTTLTSGRVLTIAGDVDLQGSFFVEGGIFAKEFSVDTTRVFLSGRFGSGGIVGEIVDSTVGSEIVKFKDEDGNFIVPFADNDLLLIQQRTGVNSGTIVKKIKRKVVADGQPSNEVSLTTTGVTTGTDTGTIAVGDNAVLDGNTTDITRDSFIAIDVLDRDIAAFGFFDNQTDFGNGTEVMRVGGMEPGGTNEYDSSLTGNIGIAGRIGGNLAFALTEDEGLIGGANFDATDMWGGSATKANATVRLDFANGQIYYDAMGGYVYNRIQEAGFSDGDQVASLTDQEWVTGISTTGTASNSANQDKIVFKWTKRFGIDTLRMYYKAKTTESTSGGTATHESRVYFNVEGLADSFDTITNTTYPASPTEKTRDVSSLTDGQTYIVSVNLYSFVDGDDTNSGTDQQSTFTNLQEDVIVIEQTQ